MAVRSLNRVELIGNLTRDAELRYTPSGTPVCTFGVATNRQWVTESGEKKEDVEFHRLVAWQKLAEICGKYLTKGKKIWIQGRLQTRAWTAQDGAQRQTTEIVVEDMIMLDSFRQDSASSGSVNPATTSASPIPVDEEQGEETKKQKAKPKHPEKKNTSEPEPNDKTEINSQDVAPEDIPF